LDGSDAMDELNCKRYCCRRMIMTHVDLIEKLLKYVSSYRSRPSTPTQLLWISSEFLTHRVRYNPAERDAKKAALVILNGSMSDCIRGVSGTALEVRELGPKRQKEQIPKFKTAFSPTFSLQRGRIPGTTRPVALRYAILPHLCPRKR